VTARVLFARNLFLPRDLGGNRYPYETIRRLGARGHTVTVATPRLHGDFPPLPNVRYFLYPVRRPHPSISHFTNVIGATFALRRLRDRFDVAIAGSYDSALALSWLNPAPLVFLFHSEFYSEWVQARPLVRPLLLRYMGAIERRVFASSARVVAVSEFSARQIAARAPSAASRVRVVPTGVDTSYFTPPDSSAAAKVAIGLDPAIPLALGVGRLAGVKQFDRLITAFAAARAQGLEAHLAIAGDGPERPRLAQLIETYGVQQHVTMAGYCDPPRLRAFMQAADLQVCSSAFENLSLAILEGMSCGTPILGTPGGGTPELVGQIDPDLLLPDDTPASISEALVAWLGRGDALQERGEQARALAVERYDWERVVDGLEQVCSEVSNAWP
jgi:glycosyltransferase involved in cell wall biosynthesis